MVELRRCYKCQEEKPLRSFVQSKTQPGGRTYRCNSCKCKALAARATTETRAKRSEKDRARRASSATTRARTQANERRYAQNNLRKNAAHVAVYKAIKRGKLTRGLCEVCSSPDVEAHHDDYAQRLSVRWLCALHHKAWHAQHGEGANANGSPRLTSNPGVFQGEGKTDAVPDLP